MVYVSHDPMRHTDGDSTGRAIVAAWDEQGQQCPDNDSGAWACVDRREAIERGRGDLCFGLPARCRRTAPVMVGRGGACLGMQLSVEVLAAGL